ncbi:hypothetical protein tb265_46460 [Gemmatimonadetes bacterium T265]|nr:hypothetical protein tb265_46460 [Gemmatimonadetes bacterium T265]
MPPTPSLASDAVARACAARFPGLPRRARARLVDYLDRLVRALPPDDRSVFVALVEGGGLEPAVIGWWIRGRPRLARASLELVWAAELRRQGLPFVPLPVLPWPEVPAWAAPPAA